MDANHRTPESWLDALREHPEWDESRREGCFAELVAGFDAQSLRHAVESRLGDLSGSDAEAILRLLEMHGDERSFRSLAQALLAQPELKPDRAWEALSVLAGSGLLDESPELAERWDELEEILSEPMPSGALAEQLNAEPESVWLALEALNAVEPELRPAILDDLRGQPARPGLVTFLQALADSDEEALRVSARNVLASLEGVEEILVGPGELAPRPLPRPHIERAWLTAVDPQGQGEVVVVSQLGSEWAGAVFLADVSEGILGVDGTIAEHREDVERFVQQVLESRDRDAEACSVDRALGLLSGVLSQSAPESRRSAELTYWLARTVGPELGSKLFPLDALDCDPSAVAPEVVRDAAERVLSACPGWVERSDLVDELGRELAERPGALAGPDPSAERFLVERALLGRLETIQRMLLWMAAYWSASARGGEGELSRACVLLAAHLGDPQHDVPGHPFLAGLARRSLAHAAEKLRLGQSAWPSARGLKTRLDDEA